jgi:CheY-like chemotaxis protein
MVEKGLAVMGLILVVEDHDDTRHVLRMLLRQWGHETVMAETGEEGMAVLSERRPDLVIVDGMMPGMNGVEFIRLMRPGESTANIPIVLYSAISDQVFAENAIEKGANEVWVKGKVDVEQIRGRVAHYVH